MSLRLKIRCPNQFFPPLTGKRGAKTYSLSSSKRDKIHRRSTTALNCARVVGRARSASTSPRSRRAAWPGARVSAARVRLTQWMEGARRRARRAPPRPRRRAQRTVAGSVRLRPTVSASARPGGLHRLRQGSSHAAAALHGVSAYMVLCPVWA